MTSYTMETSSSKWVWLMLRGNARLMVGNIGRNRKGISFWKLEQGRSNFSNYDLGAQRVLQEYKSSELLGNKPDSV